MFQEQYNYGHELEIFVKPSVTYSEILIFLVTSLKVILIIFQISFSSFFLFYAYMAHLCSVLIIATIPYLHFETINYEGMSLHIKETNTWLIFYNKKCKMSFSSKFTQTLSLFYMNKSLLIV